MEAGIPVGAAGTLVSTGRLLAERGQMGESLTESEKLQILDAGINLLVDPPGFGPHFAAAYTPLDHFEVGIRYAGSAWRAGTRFQVMDHHTGWLDLTVGLGISRSVYGLSLSSDIPGLTVDQFSRWQMDIPILVGTTHDWFQVWGGPKIAFTHFSTELALKLPNNRVDARFNGDGTFLGGQAGVAVGYRKVYLAFELTLAEGFGFANLTSAELSPSTHTTMLSSFTVVPAFGVLGEF